MGNIGITFNEAMNDDQLYMEEHVVVTPENALSLSIEKWEVIVAWAEASAPLGEKDHDLVDLVIDSPGTCGLCRMYVGDKCVDCPVALHSGNKYCLGTPYEDFDEARDDGDGKKALEAAKEELEFLRSLQEANGTSA